MCCLRYEYETYKEVNSRAPYGAKVEVPGGVARVTEINVPLERVTLQLEDGKSIKVPLAGNGIQRRRKASHRCIRGSVREVCFSRSPHSAPPPSVTSFSGNESSLITNRVKPAKASAKRKAHTHRKPRRRRSRSGSSGTEADPPTRARLSGSEEICFSERTRVSRWVAPWLRQGKQAPAAGQAGSAEPARRRAQEKQFRPGCKASRRNLRVCAMHLRKQQGEHTANGSNAGKQGEVAHRKPRRRRRRRSGKAARMNNNDDYALLTDLYQISMAQGYWACKSLRKRDASRIFFREPPFKGGYAIASGMDHIAEVVENFSFSDENVVYLASIDAPGGGKAIQS